ncbi:MAG TPA: TetR/AcrR family transcriptional regulator [Thermoanaerobaculia bacterium]|nr:TetR/AcrR family transcriptional regulator [Thermoanaerobaculia bacterium]
MTSGEAPPKRRGRPRREGADEELVSAALALLRERGYRDFTVDAVAERTGIAKTTIYRRWPTKGALAAAAIAPLVALPSERDVTALLEAMRARLAGEWGATIGALAADGIDVLGRDAFRHLVDDELTIDLLTGPLWTRLLVTREPLEEGLPAAIVARLRLR